MGLSAVVYCDSKNLGGMVTYTCNLAHALKLHDVRVSLITHTPENREEQEVLALLAENVDEVHDTPRHEPLKAQVKWFSGIIDSLEPELYFPNYRAHAFAACAAIKNKTTRCIATCHNNAEDSYAVLKRYQRVISKFVCPAQSSYRALLTKLPHRANDIRYIPHCVKIVEKIHLLPDFDGSPLRLIYHGRIDDKHKQLLLIPTLALKLLEHKIDFQITVVGEGPARSALQHAIDAANLTSLVFLKHSMNWYELSRELPRHHLALLLSSHEGFCYGLAEAMGFGLPAITFRAGGAIETYVKNGVNGFISDDGRLDEMALSIKQVYENNHLYRALSAEARETVYKTLTFERFAALYGGLIKSDFGRREAWPHFRPVYVDNQSSIHARVVEKLGLLTGLWQ